MLMFRVISIYLIKTWKTATLKCSEETVNNSLSGNSVNPVQTVPLSYVPPSHKASKQVHLSSSSRKLDFPHPPRLGLATKSKEPASMEFTVTVLAGSTENKTFPLRCREGTKKVWNMEFRQTLNRTESRGRSCN